MTDPIRQVTCIEGQCPGCGTGAYNDDAGYSPHFSSVDETRKQLADHYEWRITASADGSEQWLCRDCAAKADCERLDHDPEIYPADKIEDGSTAGQSVWCNRCSHLLSSTPPIPAPEGYPAPEHATGYLRWDAAALPQAQVIADAAKTLIDTLNAAAVTARRDTWPGDQDRRPQSRQPDPAEQAAAAEVLPTAARALQPAPARATTTQALQAGRSAMTAGQLSAAERDAHQAGASTAATVITMQLQAGMPVDRIEHSADRVLADRATDPTPASTAFYDAYSDVAYTYTAAARAFRLGPAAIDAELEAGA